MNVLYIAEIALLIMSDPTHLPVVVSDPDSGSFFLNYFRSGPDPKTLLNNGHNRAAAKPLELLKKVSCTQP